MGIIVAGWVEEIGGGNWDTYWMLPLPNHFLYSMVKDREQRMEKKDGGSVRADGESSDGWLVDGWTALNGAISQRINGPWWASVPASVLTQDFVCRHCQQSTQPCLFVLRSGHWWVDREREEILKQQSREINCRTVNMTWRCLKSVYWFQFDWVFFF